MEIAKDVSWKAVGIGKGLHLWGCGLVSVKPGRIRVVEKSWLS